MSKKVTGVRL